MKDAKLTLFTLFLFPNGGPNGEILFPPSAASFLSSFCLFCSSLDHKGYQLTKKLRISCRLDFERSRFSIKGFLHSATVIFTLFDLGIN